ncbi:MAG: hypothetical protein IPH61_07905 [Bacteroidetes bacterium]|nr:hypothetical protein [Bacteroidota bacterium]
MSTLLYTILLIGAAIFLFSIRIIFVKGGEFRGTCSSNNPMLKNEIGECTVCGHAPGEACADPNKA